MSTITNENSHPRLIELERLLHEDGVPLEKLKEAFILVNREVLKHPDLQEIMGAPEIGLVTKAAQTLLDKKLATPKKSRAAAKPKSAAALIREAAKKVEEEGEDWSEL